MMETKRRREQRSMLPVHPDAAAIDIGATVHVAAVGPARDPEPVLVRNVHWRFAPAC